MARRMAAAAELFRDLARLHGEAEAVQDAALADAGIAREGDGLAAHGLVQGGNALAAGRARRKDREPGMAVDVRERLPALEVRLVDTQHDRHILVSRNGRDAVDEERVRHGIRAGHQHDEGIKVADGRADKAVAARLDLLDHALCAGAGKADPVPDERRHPLLAEAAAGAALRERAVPAVYIVKSAERLDDASTLHAQSPDSEDSVVGSGSVGAVVGASVGASVGSGPSETSSVTIVSLATLEFAASLCRTTRSFSSVSL